MWIINSWLKQYNPTAMIHDGMRNIEKMCVLLDEASDTESTLYVSKIENLPCNTESHLIIIIHRNDIIYISNAKLEDILVEVSNAFCYYSNCETELLIEAQKDTPEQRIVNACGKVFGPIYLVDMTLNKIAMSSNYPTGTVNELWDTFMESGAPSLEQMKSFRNYWVMQHSKEHFHCKVIYEDQVSSYNFGILISYADNEGNLIGQMMITSQTEPTAAETQLAETVELALSCIVNKKNSFGNEEIVHGILLELLSNSKHNQQLADSLLLLNFWKKQDNITIIMFECNDNKNLLKTFAKRIKRLLSKSIVTVFEQSVVCCVNESLAHDNQRSIFKIADSLGMTCGVSNTYSGLDTVYIQGRQAHDALRYTRNKKDQIVYFSEYSFRILLENLGDVHYRTYCAHPALKDLMTYDEKHNTRLYATLRVFLQCERSYLDASKVMSLHRNTIISRIQKIQDTVDLDLNSAEEREYLQLSYRLLDERLS
jgi:hypothetical protein